MKDWMGSKRDSLENILVMHQHKEVMQETSAGMKDSMENMKDSFQNGQGSAYKDSKESQEIHVGETRKERSFQDSSHSRLRKKTERSQALQESFQKQTHWESKPRSQEFLQKPMVSFEESLQMVNRHHQRRYHQPCQNQ